MSKISFRHARAVIVVVAIAIVVAWHQAGRGATAPAEPQVPRQAVLTWTRLASNNGQLINASRVPGGWIVVVLNRGIDPNDVSSVGGAFFYPDPTHLWDGGSIQ